MIMYMWGTVIFLGLGIFLTFLCAMQWNDEKRRFRSGYIDAVEVAKAAHDVKVAMLATVLCWTWPVAVPALVVYGLYRLYRAVDNDSKNPTK